MDSKRAKVVDEISPAVFGKLPPEVVRIVLQRYWRLRAMESFERKVGYLMYCFSRFHEMMLRFSVGLFDDAEETLRLEEMGDRLCSSVVNVLFSGVLAGDGVITAVVLPGVCEEYFVTVLQRMFERNECHLCYFPGLGLLRTMMQREASVTDRRRILVINWNGYCIRCQYCNRLFWNEICNCMLKIK